MPYSFRHGYLVITCIDFNVFISPFSRQFQFRLRRYIQHSRPCLTTFPNISNLNSLLNVWKCGQTLCLVFDILNPTSRNPILCLKLLVQLDPSLNDFIGFGPEMYDKTGYLLCPQIWRQLRIPKCIDYIFTTVTSTNESQALSWEPVAIQDASIGRTVYREKF